LECDAPSQVIFLSDPPAIIKTITPKEKENKMARSLSVKVPTTSLVQLVEEKIATIKQEIAEYPAKRETYDSQQEAHKTAVVKFISDYLAKNIDKIGYDHNSVVRISTNYNNSRAEIVFDTDSILNYPKAPQAPEKPNESRWYGREYQKPLEMLEKNLRILKMTEQETVNASTYSSVMDLL
jgi:hypothetical protein